MPYDPTAGPGWHDVVGFVLALIAFGVTIGQLVRTTKATKAATQALAGAQLTLAQRQLTHMAAEIKSVVDELEVARTSNNNELGRMVLLRYASLAGEAQGLAERLSVGGGSLPTRLGQSSEDALNAKARLSIAAPRTVLKVTQGISTDMSTLWVELNTAGAALKNKIEVGV